jgi:asparaginyl-tRNA synthetase
VLEIESAFSDLNEISDISECMLKYVCKSLLKHCQTEICFISKYFNNDTIHRLEKLLVVDFVRVEYKEVINILLRFKEKFKQSVFFGVDLSSEHERFLVEQYFKIPIIIKNYPKELKAFYMRLNNDNKTVAAMDLLVPGVGELIGGSQREERILILDQRLLESGLKKEDYWWYRDLRRYGTVPHSGFGMGFERLISYVTGISNIRDIAPFPRTSNNFNL